MLKSIITAYTFALCLSASASIKISEPVKLQLPSGSAHPVLSPDGNLMLFSTADHTGLSLFNFTDGKTIEIAAEKAAGFNPAFSADSKTVIFRTASTDNGLTVRDTRTYTLNNGNTNIISGFDRSTAPAVSLVDNSNNYAYADYNVIKVCNDKITAEISPVADAHSYLWASLSPDRKHLVFVEPFQGIFISQPDGSNPVKVAPKGDFPSWADNNTLVFVVSHDDGYVILDSKLQAFSLIDNSLTTLSANGMLVGESSAAAGKVVFSTLDGSVYSTTLSNE